MVSQCAKKKWWLKKLHKSFKRLDHAHIVVNASFAHDYQLPMSVRLILPHHMRLNTSMSSSEFYPSPNITQPCPQVFSINGSIICSGLHFWCHFDVIGSIIFSALHFWRHWFNMAKILSKFGEQQLVMVNSACGFNQSETGKYFEWIIILFTSHLTNDLHITKW